MADKAINGVILKRMIPDWAIRCRCGHPIRRIDVHPGDRVRCPVCHAEHTVTEEQLEPRGRR